MKRLKLLAIFAILVLGFMLLSSCASAPAGIAIVAGYDQPDYIKSSATFSTDGIDDQEQIQAAIDLLNQNHGGVVQLIGFFNISSPIYMQGGVTLRGTNMGIEDPDNQGGTRLFLTDHANTSVLILDSPHTEYWPNIEDLTIDGNKLNQDAAATNWPVIWFKQGGSDVSLDHVFVRNGKGDNIAFDSGWFMRMSNVWSEGSSGYAVRSFVARLDIINSNLSSSSYGLKLNGGTTQITNSEIIGIGNIAVYSTSSAVTFKATNVKFQSSGWPIYSPNIGGTFIVSDSTFASGSCGAFQFSGGANTVVQMWNNDFSDTSGPAYIDTNNIDRSPVFTDYFFNVAAENVTAITSLYNLNQGLPFNLPINSQPDVPRNVILSVSDNDTSVQLVELEITGISAQGYTTKEIIYNNHIPGNIGWAKITQARVLNVVGANEGDAITVGYGSRYGLSNFAYGTASIFSVTKNGVYYPSWSGGWFSSVGVSINAGDNFTVRYHGNNNTPWYLD